MYLLDTNVCVYLMKNVYPSLKNRLLDHSPTDFRISAITVYELEYGASKSNWGEKTRLNMLRFLAPFTIVPFTTDDALTAGKLRSYLEKKGTPIGPYDLQIAAQGLTRNLTVITHNIDEFQRVPGLSVEDWV